jgi:PUA-domain protein
MPINRTILKERDAKPLIEEISKKVPGTKLTSIKGRVEVETIGDSEVVFVEGTPVAVRRASLLIPSLVNLESLNTLPKIVVDMGAVPHVCGGADVMAPGIRKVEGEFGEGSLVGVVDEKYGKFLAVGQSMVDSKTLRGTKKGKVVKNLHYVGDEVWESVKS